MSAISRFEVNGEISSLTGPLGSVHIETINPPPLSNVNLWSLGSKPYNTYLINSSTFFNLILPEIGSNANNAKVGYNVTIINAGINNYVIRDFNNNFILEIYAKKSVRLVALDTFQNWSFSSTLFKYNSLPGTDLLQNSISDYEYTLKNLVSTDGSLDIIDLSNQVDLKVTIPPNPVANALNIYISTTGSDSNDGLTIGTPVLTLQRALEVSNRHGWNEQVNLNFAAGNYLLPPNDPFVFKYTPLGSNSGGYVFTGDAPVLFGSYTTINTNNTTFAPTQLAMVDMGIALPPNLYDGYCAVFTSGANIGKKYQIAENIGSEIYLLTNDTFNIGDNFDICQNSTTITTRGNRFSDGYLIMSNIDIILEDRPVMNPNEIYSWEVIDSFIIYDNCRVLTNPTVTNPYILYYGDTLISSDNTHIFADAYASQNLGVSYIGSNLLNPSNSIRMDFINSFVSTGKIYSNRAIMNFQNSQSFSFMLYYNNVETVQMFATSAFFGQVVFKNCDSASSSLLQLDNNSSLFIDSVHQSGLTTVLQRCGNSSVLFINSGSFGLIDVIGQTDNLSSLSLNSVDILSMLGTNPNKTFANSNIAFSNSTFTSSSQVIEFKCCTCVSFDNLTILGDMGINFNNSSVSFNSFISNASNPLNFVNCRVIGSSLTLNPSTSTSRLSFSSTTCNFDTINLPEVDAGGTSLVCFNSNLSFNNINIQNPGTNQLLAFNINNTNFQVNNFNLSTLTSEFNYQSTSSSSHISALSINTTGLAFNIGLTNSNFLVYSSMNHSGPILSSQYFTMSNRSFIYINTLNFNSCPATFVYVGSECSIYIDNGSINSCGQFANKVNQNFGVVLLNNVVFANVNTPSDLFTLQGGRLLITNSNIGISSISSNYVFNLENCDVVCENVTIDSLSSGCFYLSPGSKLNMKNCSIFGSAPNSFNGIQSDNSSSTITSSNISNYDNGINLTQKSSALVYTVSGSNNVYGLNLISGSSACHNSASNISGGSGDVNVGALGIRSWAAVIGGITTDTNDYTNAIPQYVFITKA